MPTDQGPYSQNAASERPFLDFSGSPVVETLPSNARGAVSMVGELRSHMPCGPQNQNIKQKHYCNKWRLVFTAFSTYHLVQDCVEGHGLQKTFLCWMSLWDLSPCCPYLTHLIKPGMCGRLALSRCRVSCPVLWIHRESLCYKASHKERIWQSGWNSELEFGNLSSNTRKSLASLCPGLNKWEKWGPVIFWVLFGSKILDIFAFGFPPLSPN